MRKGGGTHRSWLIVTSVESLDKEEVEWIEKELEDINIGALELDEYDERDITIQKMDKVNRKLIEKLKTLEEVVAQTVDKAYSIKK